MTRATWNSAEKLFSNDGHGCFAVSISTMVQPTPQMSAWTNVHRAQNPISGRPGGVAAQCRVGQIDRRSHVVFRQARNPKSCSKNCDKLRSRPASSCAFRPNPASQVTDWSDEFNTGPTPSSRATAVCAFCRSRRHGARSEVRGGFDGFSRRRSHGPCDRAPSAGSPRAPSRVHSHGDRTGSRRCWRRCGSPSSASNSRSQRACTWRGRSARHASVNLSRRRQFGDDDWRPSLEMVRRRFGSSSWCKLSSEF